MNPTKKSIRSLLPLLALVGLSLVATRLSAEEHDEEAKPAVGSIHVTGKLSKAERVKLATISFDDALAAAHQALPGKVVNGALEAEDGNLQYAFEVLNSEGKIDEVAIDAGNGKVLGIDKDDKD